MSEATGPCVGEVRVLAPALGPGQRQGEPTVQAGGTLLPVPTLPKVILQKRVSPVHGNGEGMPPHGGLPAPLPTTPAAPDLDAIDELVTTTLNSSAAKDRQLIRQLEADVAAFFQDADQQELRLPPKNSFHRKVCHQVAEYFGLDHVLDAAGKAVVYLKTPRSHMSDRLKRLIDLVDTAQRESQIVEAQQVRKIMRRAGTTSGPSAAASASGSGGDKAGAGGASKTGKTLSEREEDYNRARARIFAGMGPAPPETGASEGSATASSGGGGGGSVGAVGAAPFMPAPPAALPPAVDAAVAAAPIAGDLKIVPPAPLGTTPATRPTSSGRGGGGRGRRPMRGGFSNGTAHPDTGFGRGRGARRGGRQGGLEPVVALPVPLHSRPQEGMGFHHLAGGRGPDPGAGWADAAGHHLSRMPMPLGYAHGRGSLGRQTPPMPGPPFYRPRPPPPHLGGYAPTEDQGAGWPPMMYREDGTAFPMPPPGRPPFHPHAFMGHPPPPHGMPLPPEMQHPPFQVAPREPPQYGMGFVPGASQGYAVRGDFGRRRGPSSDRRLYDPNNPSSKK